MGVHRLALDELALDRVERRQLVMPRLQCPHLGLDAEKRAQKILEMRSQCDQKLGFSLRVRSAGLARAASRRAAKRVRRPP